MLVGWKYTHQTWLRMREKSVEHHKHYESMFEPLDNSSLVQVSDYLQTKILLLYYLLSSSSMFFWYLSADLHFEHMPYFCHFGHLFSPCIYWSFHYLFLPHLFSCLLFSTSRRVLLYSFVILIDCINLLSIEFPVHHAEHNVEYYHNPSK